MNSRIKASEQLDQDLVLRVQQGDKAAYDLLSNTSIDQTAMIKSVQKVIGKDEYNQLSSRMIEQLINKSGTLNRDAEGRVVKGMTLGEKVNSISDNVWKTAFPDNPNIKADFLQLDRIAARIQQPLEPSTMGGLGFVFERAPLLIGVYRFSVKIYKLLLLPLYPRQLPGQTAP